MLMMAELSPLLQLGLRARQLPSLLMQQQCPHAISGAVIQQQAALHSAVSVIQRQQRSVQAAWAPTLQELQQRGQQQCHQLQQEQPRPQQAGSHWKHQCTDNPAVPQQLDVLLTAHGINQLAACYSFLQHQKHFAAAGLRPVSTLPAQGASQCVDKAMRGNMARQRANKLQLSKLHQRSAVKRPQPALSKQQLQGQLQQLLAKLPSAAPCEVTKVLYAHGKAEVPVQQDVMRLLLRHQLQHSQQCSIKDISQLFLSARDAGLQLQQQQQLQPLLDQALQLLQQQLGTVPLWIVMQVLALHEATAATVLQHRMRPILQHVLQHVDTLQLHQVLRMLWHTYNAGLSSEGTQLLTQALKGLLAGLSAAGPATVGKVLHAFENFGKQVPAGAMQQLAAYMAQNAAACRSRDALRVLRSAAHAESQLPAHVSNTLVQRIVDAGDARAEALVSVLKAVSHMGQQMPQRLLLPLLQQLLQQQTTTGLPVGVATAAVKALGCMEVRIPQHIMEALVLPVRQHAVTTQDMSFVLPVLVTVARSMLSLPDSELKPLLQLAREALERAAASGGNFQQGSTLPHGGMPCQQTALESNSSSQQQQQLLSAAVISELLRALWSLGYTLPGELAVPLTAVFTATQPSARDVCTFASALAGMGLACSLQQMVTLQEILQGVATMETLSSWDIGNYMWGAATMGYALDSVFVQQLAEQALSRLRAPPTNSVSQILWAAAIMAPVAYGQQLGCSKGEEAAVTAAGVLATGAFGSASGKQIRADSHKANSSGSAHESVLPAGLMRRLYEALLDDMQTRQQQQWQQQQQQLQEGSGQEQFVGAAALPVQQDAQSSAKADLQLAACAWAAAMSNAIGCRDQVLQLCRHLAQPWVFRTLRGSDLLQLVSVHQWLCRYRWSNTEGLAEIFSPDQMALMKAVKVRQVQHAARQGAQDNSPAGMQVTLTAAFKQQHRGTVGNQWQLSELISQLDNVTSGASYTQLTLFKAVRALPHIHSVVFEQITADGLFAVDVAATTHDGRLLAIEFDGPFHYLIQVSCATDRDSYSDPTFNAANHTSTAAAVTADTPLVPAQGSGSRQKVDSSKAGTIDDLIKVTPALEATLQQTGANKCTTDSQAVGALVATGPTLFRNRALEARGYKVVCIPYYKWSAGQTKRKRREQLQEVLRNVL